MSVQKYADRILQLFSRIPVQSQDKLAMISSLIYARKLSRLEGIGGYVDWLNFVKEHKEHIHVDWKLLDGIKPRSNKNIDFDRLKSLIDEVCNSSVEEKLCWLNDLDEKISQFYTPIELSKFVTAIVDWKDVKTVYDPFARSGNFLHYVQLRADKGVKIFGNRTFTDFNWNYIRNYLTDFPINTIQINKQAFDPSLPKMDLIISNPPYGKRNEPVISGEWSSQFPSKRSEVQYFTQIMDQLSEFGQAVVVLPQSILHDASNIQLRKKLIDSGWLNAVVQMPRRTFGFTAIPVCIIYINKRKNNGDVLLINTEKLAVNEGNRNILKEKVYKLMVSAISDHKVLNSLPSKIVSKSKLSKKNYNLSLGVYIQSKQLEHRDIKEILAERKKLFADLDGIRNSFENLIGSLN